LVDRGIADAGFLERPTYAQNILEKIAIFGLLAIAAISVAVVVLPRLPMDTQMSCVSNVMGDGRPSASGLIAACTLI
jgi:hypothetical protein